MQEDGKLRSHSLPTGACGLLEQSALDVVRQTIPASDNGLAQRERYLCRSLSSDRIHDASLETMRTNAARSAAVPKSEKTGKNLPQVGAE